MKEKKKHQNQNYSEADLSIKNKWSLRKNKLFIYL